MSSCATFYKKIIIIIIIDFIIKENKSVQFNKRPPSI